MITKAMFKREHLQSRDDKKGKRKDGHNQRKAPPFG